MKTKLKIKTIPKPDQQSSAIEDATGTLHIRSFSKFAALCKVIDILFVNI